MNPLKSSRYVFLAAIAVSGLAIAAACGGDDDTASPAAPVATTGSGSAAASPTTAATSAPTASPTTAPAAASGDANAVVQVRDVGSLGKVLVTPAGLTLYTFKSDAPNSGKSACSGGCAATWPPLTTTAATVPAPAGVTGSFALITRDDGAKQVTFNGQPLYRYAADAAPGDAKGDGIGSVWFAAKISATTTSSSGSSDPYGY
jgi:predicted lipoprotein with Yx(FWY)xxD motif